ncbi:MAG: sigma-70 family RNA polymerase sigma factor [Candidatus Moranbacteria bacterium]|nr:sigma-70 family RNA polymerase sigma factor [Candidatus Moranbacteria bacterium]
MKMEDNQLVKIFLEGEDEAFEDLVKKYLKPVYNFLYRLTNDQAVVEDLAQDTFLKAWKNMRRFDQKRNFKAWIFTIAKNTAFDFFRKKKEIPFSRFADEDGRSWLENIEDDEFLPDEILERKNIAEELDEILQKIPLHYRTILLLHYKEEFSLHEIAEILGEPYNTVKSRHQRALLRLKKALLSDQCV